MEKGDTRGNDGGAIQDKNITLTISSWIEHRGNKLKFIDLTQSQELTGNPDFSDIPNLESCAQTVTPWYAPPPFVTGLVKDCTYIRSNLKVNNGYYTHATYMISKPYVEGLIMNFIDIMRSKSTIAPSNGCMMFIA
ncbi:hypothetical protein RJ639_012828 [Escallonia herrerae]|uniref:Uncharacterized protein n=1 Tax=Escallonia herrerae TaxID=1293975 RepID=A0AA89AQ18_9ASTE|nr:hypothetical protein RJ639_012828 [Escallonia herrerae]